MNSFLGKVSFRSNNQNAKSSTASVVLLKNRGLHLWRENQQPEARELADEIMKQGMIESISVRHVGRLLEEAQLKPHQSRYWLTPPDDEFDVKVENITELYISAIERDRNGERTISIDEMTGIQATERKEKDLPMRPGKVQLREFEYIRHGTQSLIAMQSDTRAKFYPLMP